MKRGKSIFTISLLSLFVLFFSALNIYAGQISYNRGKAIDYASKHCGTSEETKYNFTDYKCWNGYKPECVKDNPGIKDGCKDKDGNPKPCYADCANFDSQAMIAGSLDFSCVKPVDTIGKDGKTKGLIGVSPFKSALTRNFCFEVISDPSKAKAGDILSQKKSSHVVIYSGVQSKTFIDSDGTEKTGSVLRPQYYGHTTNRCRY